jgi:alkylhydroperoxidase/carboxymuconolactone decarboxylase family protein YurZ
MSRASKEPPSGAGDIARTYPAVWQAYADLGKASADAGPIEGQTLRLVKLALAIGVGSEGAVHSHVRQAIEEGIAADTLRHAALLAIPTIGFPQAVKALRWIEDVVDG